MSNCKGKQYDGLTHLHQCVCLMPSGRSCLLVPDLKDAPLNRWVTLRQSIQHSRLKSSGWPLSYYSRLNNQWTRLPCRRVSSSLALSLLLIRDIIALSSSTRSNTSLLQTLSKATSHTSPAFARPRFL